MEAITPLILTYNEAPNLRRTLERLTWAKEIVIVDSGSTDETLAIAAEFSQVRVVPRAFDTFAQQCDFGLTLIRTEWVLSLDADYVLTPELVAEIRDLQPGEGTSGYQVAFRFCVHGRPLRTCLYPPRTVLYRRANARYRNEGHGHRVQIDGAVVPLNGKIDHDDRKPLERWLREQNRYATAEVEHLFNTPVAALNFPDRIRRRIVFAPFLVFFYTLLIQGLILDGWPGWFYVWQRTLAEMILSLRLTEQKLKAKKS